jgi:threonine aldolase
MSSSFIDLRSDTVTKPTAEMRQAMFDAEVGDDVYSDDPTILKLQEMAAKLLGKEAALFVPSGTMGNLICVLNHCSEFGSEMILGDESHIHIYEQGGCATLGRIHSRTVPTQRDGTLLLKDIEQRIRTAKDNDHLPLTKVVCLENTHNRMGGKVLTVEYIQSVAQLCKQYGLKLHMDGARLMNAAVELNIDPAKLVESCDSVSFCLSKGLAAPVGSLVIGTHEFIRQAKRLRKVLGGGMRQAGVLAAAGIISLTEMPKLLKFDHQNAKLLAEGLSKIDGCEIDPEKDVQTNIVYFILNSDKIKIDGQTFCDILKREYGILVSAPGKWICRFVTHYMITRENIEYVIEQVKCVLEKNKI